MDSKLKLTLLRFLGYVGVACSSIAVPMLVYLITHNVSLAGLYVFAEWTTKVSFYAIGGTFLSKNTLQYSMLRADFLRIIGYIVLIVVYIVKIKFLLLFGVVLIQMGNGVSNLIYERSVFYLWQDKLKGYSALIKLDYLAIAISVFLGLIFNNILVLLIISLVILTSNFFINRRYGQYIFPNQEIKLLSNREILKQTKQHFADITKNKNIINLIIMAFIFSTTINMIFSSLSFFVEDFSINNAYNIRFIACLIALKALSSSFTLHLFNRLREKNIISENNYLQIGVFVWLLSFIGIYCHLNLTLFIVSIIFANLGNCLITVWLRNHRLKYIDKSKRNEQISVIISLECTSYILSGLLVTVSKVALNWLLVANIFLVVLLVLKILKVKSQF